MDNAQIDHTRVFLAEDSVPLRSRLATMLSAIENVSVVGEAATPGAAIEGILRTRPAYVVLDIHLSEGRGISVLREIRKTDASAVFIVLTNMPTPQYRKVYMQAGADYFLDKAIEFERVRQIVAGSGAHHSVLPTADVSNQAEKNRDDQLSAAYR